MANHYGITEKEKELINQLRDRVRDKLPPNELSKSEDDQDLYLIQWLRARNMDVENATTMLLNNLQWRKENRVDEILQAEIDPEVKASCRFTLLDKTDKFGHPVVLVPYGEWDFGKFGSDPKSAEEMDKAFILFFESMTVSAWKEHSQRKDGHPPITQALILLDVKDFAYMQLTNLTAIKRIAQMARFQTNYYPDIVFKAIFINAPSYYGLFFNILKPIISTKTYESLATHSTVGDWQKGMDKLVDPSILPERYGGTQKDTN